MRYDKGQWSTLLESENADLYVSSNDVIQSSLSLRSQWMSISRGTYFYSSSRKRKVYQEQTFRRLRFFKVVDESMTEQMADRSEDHKTLRPSSSYYDVRIQFVIPE
jgi:hypothetical protein